MRKILLSAIAATCAMAVSAQAAVVVYLDRTDFESASSGARNFENFDDGSIDGIFSVTSGAGFIANNQWEDRLDPGIDSTTWMFSSAVTSFGGEWDLAGPGGEGTGILITLTLFNGSNEVLSMEIPNTLAGSFWGFVSDVSFTSMLLTSGTQNGVAETYSFDNMTAFGGAPVPLPAAAPFFILGAMGAGWVRRRKAKTA